MYQVSENTLAQLEEITEKIGKLSSLRQRILQADGLQAVDYRRSAGQLPAGEGPQARRVNQLCSLERRIEVLEEHRQEICLALLDYLLALPGQSQRDFAVEYYLHGRRNFKEIAGLIGLSLERTYHLRREVREGFAALLHKNHVLRLCDSDPAEDGIKQQCSGREKVVG